MPLDHERHAREKKNLVGKTVDYYYDDEPDGKVTCRAYALGIEFQSVLIYDGLDYDVEYWDTSDINGINWKYRSIQN